MKLLRRKQQKECLVNLGMIQLRIMEALPLLVQVAPYGDCRYFFNTTLECLAEIAKTIDPNIGLKFLQNAREISETLIKREEGNDDEQGNHDREPGE